MSNLIVCPVCQKSNLMQDNGFISCQSSACHFKVNMSEINYASLSELEDRLDQAISKVLNLTILGIKS